MLQREVYGQHPADRAANDMGRIPQAERIHESQHVRHWRPWPRTQLGVAVAAPVRGDDIEIPAQTRRLRLQHTRVGYAGVEEDDRKTETRSPVVDARAIDELLHL